jgi:hypothetical protein
MNGETQRERAEKAEAELKEWENERAYIVEHLCRKGEHGILESVDTRLWEIKELRERLAKSESANEAMRVGLLQIASYDEGPEVDSSFDEPGSAAIARNTLSITERLE